MTSSKSFSFAATALSIAAAGFLFSLPGYAVTLTTADLSSPGDNLLTVDPSTHLEFLDPAATSGLTYNQIGSSDFVTNQGFSFATTGQLRQLLSDGGVNDFSGNFNTTDQDAVENLLENFIGETITGPITLPPAGMREISDGVYGFTEDPDVPSGQFNVAGLDYQSAALGQAPQDQARTILNLITFPGDATTPNPQGNGINGSIAGGFLVRPVSKLSVPEPSAMGMMGVALLMLIWIGFCQRERKHSGRA